MEAPLELALSTIKVNMPLIPFDFAVWFRLRRRIAPFEFADKLRALRLRTLRLWLRIAPRSHPSTSPVNPEPRSRIRLHQDRTPGSHRDGTDCTDHTEIAIEKWLGFDEFDGIWWIFFGWVLFLCLSIENCFGGGYKFRWLWVVVGGCKWWVFAVICSVDWDLAVILKFFVIKFAWMLRK